MPVKLLFLSLLLFTFSLKGIIYAQSYIENQILVQLDDRDQIGEIVNEIKIVFKIDSDIKSELIADIPLAIWKLEFTTGLQNIREIINFLNQHDHVVNAQFNHVIESRTIPNDPQFDQQWHLKNTGQGGGNPGSDIDAERAWNLTTGGISASGDTIVICVIDNGLDLDHEDIQGNIWINHNEIPGNGIDDDNNGYIDDYYGWNSVDKNGSITKGAHGTQASGLIGAVGNNNTGVAGINWDVKIMPVIFGGSEAQALASYSYAYQMRKLYNETGGSKGAFIVATNSSFGINYAKAEDYPIWCSMYDSLGSVGILNIVATSNTNVNVDADGDMPSSCPGEFIIAVTNIDRTDNRASSGFGAINIDIGAYGSGVLTIRPDNRYSTFNGTSAATPIVTGITGLIYSYSQGISEIALENPAAAALMAKESIFEGSRPIESLKGLTVTGAAANAYGALRSIEKYDSECAPPYLINIDTIGADLIGISWPDDSIKKFNLIYRHVNNDWQTVENIKSPYILGNLDFCSPIEIRMQQVCDDIGGEYGYAVKLTTIGCCSSPDIIDHYIENGKLHIEWEDVYAADSYDLFYKFWPDPYWTNATTTSKNIEIEIENACGMYMIKLQSECKGVLSEEKPHYVLGLKCPDCDIAQYCFPEMNNDFEWIEMVRIGEFINTSGKNFSGYGIFSHTPSNKFIENESYTIEVDIGFRNFEFKDSIYLWIDLNSDGVFQPGEMLAKGSNGEGRSVKLEFTVPQLPFTGHTRMRILLNSNSNSSPCEIGNFDYGEYEDYCVLLGKNKLCDIQDLDIAVEYSPTYETVLKWDDKGQIYRYMVSVRSIDDDTDFTPLAFTAENELNISSLDTCENYEIKMEVYCSPYDISRSFYHRFKTRCSDKIAEINTDNFIIFPNPTGNNVNISLQNKTGVFDLKLTNISGKEIILKSGLSGDITLKLDEFDLASGIYLLHLRTGSQTFNYKIIKL